MVLVPRDVGAGEIFAAISPIARKSPERRPPGPRALSLPSYRARGRRRAPSTPSAASTRSAVACATRTRHETTTAARLFLVVVHARRCRRGLAISGATRAVGRTAGCRGRRRRVARTADRTDRDTASRSAATAPGAADAHGDRFGANPERTLGRSGTHRAVTSVHAVAVSAALSVPAGHVFTTGRDAQAGLAAGQVARAPVAGAIAHAHATITERPFSAIDARAQIDAAVEAAHLADRTQDALALTEAVRERIAVKLSKICNDLRLLNNERSAGELAKSACPRYRPAPSIMPGEWTGGAGSGEPDRLK